MVYFVLFLRKRLLHFLCRRLCYLVLQENVQTSIKGKTLRNSHSEMLFKITVLKNFAVLSRKHLCWSLHLLKLLTWRPAFLLKKRLQRRFFPVNVAKFLSSFYRTHLVDYFSEILCDDRSLWTSLGTKLTFFIFLVSLLCFPLQLY